MGKKIQDIDYIEFIIALIFSYILVELWYDFLKLFFFDYLKLEKNSVLIRLLICFGLTIIFFSFALLYTKIQSFTN